MLQVPRQGCRRLESFCFWADVIVGIRRYGRIRSPPSEPRLKLGRTLKIFDCRYVTSRLAACGSASHLAASSIECGLIAALRVVRALNVDECAPRDIQIRCVDAETNLAETRNLSRLRQGSKSFVKLQQMLALPGCHQPSRTILPREVADSICAWARLRLAALMVP